LLPAANPVAGVNAPESEATSFAAGRVPSPTSEPTAAPFAIAAWIPEIVRYRAHHDEVAAVD